jgi:predicted MFS family arabinose efflux permease
VTSITLLGGLASSVFWPLTHALLASVEWRGTCAVFAVLLVACSLLYARLLPGDTGTRSFPLGAEAELSMPHASWPGAPWLLVAFAGAAFVGGALSAHLVSLLGVLRFASSSAVWIASSVGIFQVLGRIVELLARGRIPALRLGVFVFTAIGIGLLCLLASGQQPWFALPFVLLYGTANGLLTVVRAVVPLELFGAERAGAVLGGFARPSLVARALAPAVFSALAASLGPIAALSVTAGVAVAALLAFAASARNVHERSSAGGITKACSSSATSRTGSSC